MGATRRLPKERVDVLGRGHSVVIEDFSSLVVDGKPERLGGQDKGHRALLAAFRAAVARGGDSAVTLDALATSRSALEALAGLGEGGGGCPGARPLYVGRELLLIGEMADARQV